MTKTRVLSLFFTILLLANAQAAEADTARATVGRFYKAYLGYLSGLGGKTRSPQQAQAEDAAVVAPFLSSAFRAARAKQAKICASKSDDIPEGCDGDPFTCAQEPPSSFKLLDGDGATVGVELCFNCDPKTPASQHEHRQIQAKLVKTGTRWQIDAIACQN